MRPSAEPIVLLADALAVVEAAGYVVERQAGVGRPVVSADDGDEVRRLRGALVECRRATEAKPAWVDGGIHYSEMRRAVRAATREQTDLDLVVDEIEQITDDYDDDGDCHTCQGYGSEECDDPLSCFVPDCDGDFHCCPNCRGSGSARDERYW